MLLLLTLLVVRLPWQSQLLPQAALLLDSVLLLAALLVALLLGR